MSELLPNGWVVTTIGEVTTNTTQRQPQLDERFIYIDIGSIDRETKRIATPQELVGQNAPSRARKVVQTGDVLVSTTRPNLNAIAIVSKEFNDQIASTGFDVLRASEVDPRWLFYTVRTTAFIEAMSGLVQGALYPAVRSRDVRSFEMPLAPLNEQKRIADKLDRLLARVDACRERCDRIPLILKRFRQSVLSAATSGELTEDWRVSEQTDQWQSVLLSDVCLSITDGDYQAPPQVKQGIPFITIAAINDGKLRLDKATRFVSQEYFEQRQPSIKPQLGDVLFSVTGSIAIPALVDTEDLFTFQRHIAILKPDLSKISSRFLFYSLGTEKVKSQSLNVATGTAQLTIPLSGLRRLVIDLPTKDEQDEIVRRVETLFVFADRLEARYQNARAQVDLLTPALLDKAFQGELVPQDPNDEPASVLLARIRAEQENQPTKSRKVSTRKSIMTSLSKEDVQAVIRQLPKNTFSFDELRQKLPGDYDTLKDIILTLLGETDSSLTQVFDEEAQAMRFVRGSK